jgi:hypothetical protein
MPWARRHREDVGMHYGGVVDGTGRDADAVSVAGLRPYRRWEADNDRRAG